MTDRTAHVDSPLGPITFTQNAAGALTSLIFHRAAGERAVTGEPVAAALAAYFAGDLSALDALAVAPAGTEFQRRVWAALRRIPPGTTCSYGDLAAATGSVARAVGAANGANPVGLAIPCHRVIGQGGDLVGYAAGLDIKRWLLRHEGALLL